jgi:hypothetical protein
MGNTGSTHRTEDIDSVSSVHTEDIRKLVCLGTGETGNQFTIITTRKNCILQTNTITFAIRLRWREEKRCKYNQRKHLSGTKTTL